MYYNLMPTLTHSADNGMMYPVERTGAAVSWAFLYDLVISSKHTKAVDLVRIF
ncbi:hypothetical protein G3M74_17910 [Paenibacillus polymyxa]|nr:hypothetical protein [Paenibacillus polymyxa]